MFLLSVKSGNPVSCHVLSVGWLVSITFAPPVRERLLIELGLGLWHRCSKVEDTVQATPSHSEQAHTLVWFVQSLVGKTMCVRTQSQPLWTSKRERR
jgi:hypothetical protein